MFQKWILRLFIVVLVLWFLLDVSCHLGAEIFWFQEVGYVRVLWLRLVTQCSVWVVVTGITATYLLGNLSLAQHLKYPQSQKVEELRLGSEIKNFLSPQYPRWSTLSPPRKPLRLPWLLFLALGLSLLIELILIHYGDIAFNYWKFPLNQTSLAVPVLFRPQTVWQIAKKVVTQVGYCGLVGGLSMALLTYTQFWLRAIAVVFSISVGFIASHHWIKVLQYFHPTAFNITEPLLNQDISFYIFTLPVWELIELWLTGLCLYGLVAVTLTYLLSGDSLSRGNFPGFSPSQQRHLIGLGGLLLLVVAWSYWLSRYQLVYSPRGVSFGASYTDVTVQLPAYGILSVFAAVLAVYLLWGAFVWQHQARSIIVYSLKVYLGLMVVGGIVLPELVQYLIVQPNELQREKPYIQRTIALTRQAFNLEKIETITFNPQGKLTKADIQSNDLTIRNIRLWDQQPLLQTNRQLQQIRPYYKFPSADIDRYTIKTPGEPKKRQVIIAARELDYSAVPKQAQTWVNRNLIYTHGYGFTVNPVNTADPGGLPEYFVKDITGGNHQALTTSSQVIRESIPISQPRIYYGEITDNHIMTGTKVRELDYPSGSDNVYNIYDGIGGIQIRSLWRRCLFAVYLRDWQMLLSREVLPDTKVLFWRNINQRIRAIAPFLHFDSNPYIVAEDVGSEQFPGHKSDLYWIVDAYTVSDHYPYSDTGMEGINYIRNSVKVVIDAYNGTVNLYVADPGDPIIVKWSKIFPQMFKPLEAMPVNLRNHIRYPVDFFNIQSERLMTYHMTDPQVFYNREDQWEIPNEIYGNQTRQLEAYYLITSLPTFSLEEFVLILPYTPKERTNLIAWLAARSDGENYGKLVMYIFPKERLVFGTEQIEARINQDPVISQQISLWNRKGSRAIQGNLLVIPIEQSLLYVEPIYLEATQNSLPTLVRVVVAYENRIVMAQTLELALQAIFQPEITPPQAIIRPVAQNMSPS